MLKEFVRKSTDFKQKSLGVPGDFDNPKEAHFSQIVSDKQRGKVEGTMVDLFSASAKQAVLDALNETNKEKFLIDALTGCQKSHLG